MSCNLKFIDTQDTCMKGNAIIFYEPLTSGINDIAIVLCDNRLIGGTRFDILCGSGHVSC